MNKFECIECGTRYTSTETTPPPGIKWIDGHVCAPKPVKDETKTKMYSEEDMLKSFMACWKANVPEGFECKLSFKEWFKQFKNK